MRGVVTGVTLFQAPYLEQGEAGRAFPPRHQTRLRSVAVDVGQWVRRYRAGARRGDVSAALITKSCKSYLALGMSVAASKWRWQRGDVCEPLNEVRSIPERLR